MGNFGMWIWDCGLKARGGFFFIPQSETRILFILSILFVPNPVGFN